MTSFRTILAALVIFGVIPASADSRLSDAAPTTAYSLSALAVLGPGQTELSLKVTSSTAPVPPQLEKVQVKIWPLGAGAVVTRNYFDVAAAGGAATLQLDPLARLQRVQVRVHVKEGSQNVLEAETVAQYRALGAVSSDHRLATAAGEQMLRAGGNAFDAAAAVLFVLNVTQPHLAGIGGSSNVVTYVAAEDRVYAIDARETAPALTTVDMYKGRPDITVQGFSVGVPGTLLAVERMLERWGTMTLAETLEPAIGHAKNGVDVGSFLAKSLADPVDWKVGFQTETKNLFAPGGTVLKQGDRLVQPALAETLGLVAERGSSVFYRGEIAPAIVEAQKRSGYPEGAGRMTLADLAAYDVVVREASHLDYRGYDVYAAAPSSSGGIVLLQALGLLEDARFPIGGVDAEGRSYAFGTRYTIHAMAEAMRLAIADRDAWVGDPAFVSVPETILLSDAYLRDRSTRMSPYPTRMPVPVPPGDADAFAEPDELGHTTHFSVIDRYGNVVSFTTTMADAFGSGILVPKYGFLLNDSLRLFNATPSGGPNDAAPGKRPAGSMTPVVLMRGGEPFAATGTWGQSFIPSLVLNVVLDLVDHRMTLQQAVDASRMWIANPSGAYAWNRGRRGAPSFAQSEIDAIRDLGPPRPMRNPSTRDEVFGSLASIGVDPATLDLIGAADDARQPDAAAEVVERSG
jgi:gamma-glutamyltranspeptidase/glutathione hydrolase